MCSIFGSYNRDKFIQLARQNQYRGNFSYSIGVIDLETREDYFIHKDFGEFNEDKVPVSVKGERQFYYIGHVQAPTGGLIKDENRIHPSEYEDSFLYHNGLLKDAEIERLKIKHQTYQTWDTGLLHIEMHNHGFPSLSEVDGSFGCAFIDQEKVLHLFTSDIICLYMDLAFNFSSTPFDGATRIAPGMVYMLDVHNFKLFTDPELKFTSKSSPYYFTQG